MNHWPHPVLCVGTDQGKWVGVGSLARGGLERPVRNTHDTAERPWMKQKNLECWQFLWGRIAANQIAVISPAYTQRPGKCGFQCDRFNWTDFNHFNKWICFIGKAGDLRLHIVGKGSKLAESHPLILRESTNWSSYFSTQSMASFCPLVAAQLNCTGRYIPWRRQNTNVKVNIPVYICTTSQP